MTNYVSGSLTNYGNTDTYSAARFQAWVGEIRAMLNGVGLVQTSDTGQINPATSNPASSSDGGYEVWRFSDAAQATDPVFLRIRYRRDDANCGFRLLVAIGQGSDGAGNLTGQVSGTYNLGAVTTNGGASGTHQNYAYFGNGVFWMADVVAASGGQYTSRPRNFILIARPRDTSNALNGRGIIFLLPNGYGAFTGGHGMGFTRWAGGTPTNFPFTTNFCMLVGRVSNDFSPGTSDRQAWPHFYYDNGVKMSYAAFSLRNVSLPTTPTGFYANPFGFGSSYWITWSTAPNGNDLSDGLTKLALPWDAP